MKDLVEIVCEYFCMKAQYVKISVCSTIIGSTYIELTSRLKHSKKV